MKKKLLLALLSLLLLPLGVIAQNVTISPYSGSLVATIGDNGQTGSEIGLSSLWRHEQLQLSLTAADRDGLLDNGEISFPSTVLGVRENSENEKKLVILGGHRPTYLVVSLPKGYRITGYKLVLVNDLKNADFLPNNNNTTTGWNNVNGNQDGPGGTNNSGNGTMRFFECKPWTTNTTNSRVDNNAAEGFDGDARWPGYKENYVRYIEPGAWVIDGGFIGTPASDIITWAKRTDNNKTITDIKTGDNKEFTIERHSMSKDDMGNQLYFRLVKDFSYYGLTIKSFNIDFTAEGTFDAPVAPVEAGEAQMVVRSPFPTSKTDIGKMGPLTQEGSDLTYFSYNYKNVRELTGYNYLYQQGAVPKNGNGIPHEVAGVEAHIHPVFVDGHNRYALNNDLYYVEPPTSINTSSGDDAPIGYRIVGAKFKYLWGTESNGGETTEVPNAVTIYFNTPSSYETIRYWSDDPTSRYFYTERDHRTVNNDPVYLNSILHFSTNTTNTTWQVDDDGYIYNARGYLTCYGNDDLFRTISQSTAEPGTDAAKWYLRIDSENSNLYYQDSEGKKYYLQVPIMPEVYDDYGRLIQTAGQVNPSEYPRLYKNVEGNTGLNPNYYAKSNVQSKIVTLSEFHPGAYTLKVYGKEGVTYTKEEAETHNASLDEAVHAGDPVPTDYETKVGSPAAGALTATEAAAYNATLEGAVEAGDPVPTDYETEVGSPAAGTTLTADEAVAYNATLEGAVEAGDAVPTDYETEVGSPAARTTLTAAEAVAYNATLNGAVKADDEESKKNPVFETEVAGTSDTGTFTLEHLNNDAVAFEISGLESGKQAIVEVTLQLQALDPYINSMDIVCTDIPRELQMIQTFTANDFRVSGGEFVFYVPSKYRGQKMNLEFSNLRSDYADETYPTGSNMHNSRYSFVTSEYFEPIDGDGDDGLYDDAYSPDASCTNKIIAKKAGNIRFKFNNAEDIGIGSTGSAYLIESPFSVQNYLGSADPDPTPAGQTPKTGEFIPCQVTAGDGAQEFGTFYLFTADEPRYNIAPTKALQHRSYAFYRMDVKVVAKDYDPVLEWVPIYDNSLYGDDLKSDSQWGLIVTTNEKGTTTPVKGYLTYEDIIDQLEGCEAEEYTDAEAVAWNERLEGAIASGTVLTAEQASAVNAAVAGASYAEGGTITAAHSAAYNATLTGHISGGEEKKAAVTKKLKEDNDGAPATTQQILYIDGSNLLYILEDDNINETTLKNKIGRNAFIFLPVNVTSEVDNVAFKTESGSFKAARNVVFTDKHPFFTPYDIQVGAANYATYSREMTVQKNGKVSNASVMLPFTLRLDNSGVHTNPTGSNIPGSGLKFTVNTLGSETVDIEKDAASEYGPCDHGIAYFKPYIDIVGDENTTAANKSYMVKVENGDAPADSKISFIATQTGALIEETLHPTEADAYTHTGELIPGDNCDKEMTFGDETLVFKNYGTYSGTQFSRDNNNIFYFANNQYLSMTELVPSMKLNMFPFRGVFAYTVTGTSPSRKYSLKHFDVSYDEPSLGDATGIDDKNVKADLMIRTDKGSMTISSTKEQIVTVYSTNGIRVAKANMQGGDTQTINLPSGVYVVNNVKIAVK